jgi:hypothetical protein
MLRSSWYTKHELYRWKRRDGERFQCRLKTRQGVVEGLRRRRQSNRCDKRPADEYKRLAQQLWLLRQSTKRGQASKCVRMRSPGLYIKYWHIETSILRLLSMRCRYLSLGVASKARKGLGLCCTFQQNDNLYRLICQHSISCHTPCTEYESRDHLPELAPACCGATAPDRQVGCPRSTPRCGYCGVRLLRCEIDSQGREVPWPAAVGSFFPLTATAGRNPAPGT